MTTYNLANEDSKDLIYMLTEAIEIVNSDEEEQMTFSEKSVVAPDYMKAAAKRGLALREKQTPSNRCCLPAGLARARQLSNGQRLSLKTIKRIKSFASRHGANLKADTPKDSKLVQSLLLWGIPASPSGIKRVVAWADAQIRKLEKK